MVRMNLNTEIVDEVALPYTSVSNLSTILQTENHILAISDDNSEIGFRVSPKTSISWSTKVVVDTFGSSSYLYKIPKYEGNTLYFGVYNQNQEQYILEINSSTQSFNKVTLPNSGASLTIDLKTFAIFSSSIDGQRGYVFKNLSGNYVFNANHSGPAGFYRDVLLECTPAGLLSIWYDGQIADLRHIIHDYFIANEHIINGTVTTDGTIPIQGVKVNIVSDTNKILAESTTDVSGAYSLVTFNTDPVHLIAVNPATGEAQVKDNVIPTVT
jgi:hypothetical protein